MSAPSTCRWLGTMAVLVVPLALACPARADDDIRITVQVILATDRNNQVEEDLKEIAEKVRSQLKDPQKLTGFRKGRQSSKTLTIGAKEAESFSLVEDQVVTVRVEAVTVLKNMTTKIRLVVKPPTVGQITYTTCCEKFFPIVTRYETKDKERLIVAIMADNCKK